MTNKKAACRARWRQTRAASRHWLLDAIYGRELLKDKLRHARPDLKVPFWRDGWELDPLLEQQVHALGLREWPRPEGLVQHLAYLRAVLRMATAVHFRRPVPHWGS
ncbi:hypothetical protein FN976_16955 [Caenimonas sedimenti]|uniref:Uncharacterized protein n=1 Tax=Caenimonas sedimenti TaxID=2596921 RepID=A0A562ZNT2_9BURK|nr:hypothetical protein [Caenimonas sedimenti]TWO70031.1 hypothetical protein FN976_16955 [Caenimonas sedimenti]